jgi:hypothetical protein
MDQDNMMSVLKAVQQRIHQLERNARVTERNLRRAKELLQAGKVEDADEAIGHILTWGFDV